MSTVFHTECVFSEVIAAVKKLAKHQRSSALAQLPSRIAAVAKSGAADDVFAKIKGLITDMAAKLEKEAEVYCDATDKVYCDEEMSKTESKKAEFEDDVMVFKDKDRCLLVQCSVWK